MIAENDLIRCFPHQHIRPEQRDALEFSLGEFSSGKRIVILEMGTGCGKSATAVALARLLNDNDEDSSGAYILTTQKMLQDQYNADFGPTSRNLLRSLKSSANYDCISSHGQTCAEIRRITSNVKLKFANSDADCFKRCRTHCPYVMDKQAFIASQISVTNFAYFFAETLYAGKLLPRDLLIIDECHNIESELGRFIEVTFSERFARDVLKCCVPRGGADQHDVFDWIAGAYRRAVVSHLSELEVSIKSQLGLSAAVEDIVALTKRFEIVDKHLCKINRFIEMYESGGWIMNTEQSIAGTRGGRKFEFKPVSVAEHSENALFKFGALILMMSATVVDHGVFCRSVGLDPTTVAFKRIPSPFPIENRKIHFMPIGSMSRSKIDATLPKMVEGVKAILAEHANDKGIIHCVNYKIARALVDAIRDPRLLIHDATNRDEILAEHAKSSMPTVLVSPSMGEGVDLAGDLSRFQILVKVPYPFLGDEVVRRRMAADPMWYPYQTARAMIQSLGRSVRSETDFAVSYVLDEDWGRFYRDYASMFPEEFKDAII